MLKGFYLKTKLRKLGFFIPVILFVVLSSMKVNANEDISETKNQKLQSVTGISNSVGQNINELSECRAAQWNAEQIAAEICSANGYTKGFSYKSFNPCLDRIIFTGKKVKLSFICRE